MDCFLFNGLSSSERELCLKLIDRDETQPKGSELYRNGYLCILISGSARIRRITESGNAVTVRSIRSGEVFGAASVFGDGWDDFSSIVAEASCRVCYISEEALKKMITEVPTVALNYITYLSEKIRFLNRRIDMFSANSTEQKLYEFLSSSADENGEFNLGFSLSELSRRLKIGRTSLYRGLDSLEAAGLIERSKNIFRIK